jgi:hypothetical protein
MNIHEICIKCHSNRAKKEYNNTICNFLIITCTIRKYRIMKKITAQAYTELMLPWLNVLPDFLRTPPACPELAYYGTGESAHWPVQSNCNVFAALAVLSDDPFLPETRRAELRSTALRLLRYSLSTHLTGDRTATDGKQWGRHWISVLGLERMAHGVNAIREHLTADDRERFRRMVFAEADFRLNEYQIVAGISGAANKPESNIWNGGFLLRAALDYPDAPDAPRWREKATAYLLNGISHPSDAVDETVFNGRPAHEWHIAPNFTENYSLDHHGYLNVGYMVICLSNLAMLHFNFKERGQTAPPELYRHLKELWALVKQLTFADGRLLRIGGDTRSRYTYCQNYAVPAWLLAADLFGDADAEAFEARWLETIRKEAEYSGDGGFYSRRLANIRDHSYYYYTRLESDLFLCLSYGAYWRRKFTFAAGEPPAPADFIWQDPFHGAAVQRKRGAVRSWVWHGGQGAAGLCVPAHRSDMAEWQRNLCGELVTPTHQFPFFGPHEQQLFEAGFLSRGESEWRQLAPLGEGEGEYPYARQQTVCAALPDGRTMLVLDFAEITKEVTLRTVKGLNLKIPNDLFNGSARRYQGDNFTATLYGNPGADDTRFTGSPRLSVDGELSVLNLYGGAGLIIHRPAEPQIVIRKTAGPPLHSLYADEICNVLQTEPRRRMPSEIALDGGAAVSVSAVPGQGSRLELPGRLRGVEYRGTNGTRYILTADFGDGANALPEFKGRLLAKIRHAALWEIQGRSTG